MKKYGITAHCLVRNEERWVWYAINSVIDYVDQVLIFDTGSTDRTVEIIKSIKSPKIVLEQKGIVDKKTYTQLRQEMIERTETPWFMVLDGDEVWPRLTIEELIKTIQGAPRKKEAIIVSQWVCQGDVFHYSFEVEQLREDKSGRRGFWLPRALRNLPGLHAIGEYGNESYADKKGINISYWDRRRLTYAKQKFFHMSFLPRSSNRSKDRQVMMRGLKTRFHRGLPFKNVRFPEVFYLNRPNIVSSPWKKLTRKDKLKGLYYRSQNLLERVKRSLSLRASG